MWRGIDVRDEALGTAITFSTCPRVVEVAEDSCRFLAGGLKVDVRGLRVTTGDPVDGGRFRF